jgi:hypothetical protein
MKLELIEDAICLKPKQLLKVRGGAGHTVVCHSGSVWLTQARDWRDVVLGAGESFALDRNGPALLQAFEQTAVSIGPTATTARFASPNAGAFLSGGVAAA